MRRFLLSNPSFLFFISALALAQSSGTLRGQIADPSAAVIPGVRVTLTSADGHTSSTQTDGLGNYEFKGLAPGSYSVNAAAKGFLPAKQPVEVVTGKTQQVDFKLQILVEKQEIEVQEESPTLDVSPENNASAIVIKGKDLDALSDDPDELAAELQALAGPSAGPNGGQIYIDGFTGGQLPPKASIREIRINQNPFSAEYDKLGYGRIEIFTKPGTDKFHGQVMVMGNDSSFNSLNPFVTSQPGYSTQFYETNVGGPMTKSSSFFLNAERRDINDTSIVNAAVLKPDLTIGHLTEAISAPRVRTNVTPRFDLQFGKNNTLTLRYQFEQDRQDDNGIGQFSLPSQAFNVRNTEQTLQLSDTETFGAHVVNETRFQYIRGRNNQLAQDFVPTISVLGAFTGGGNSLGTVHSKSDRYELQNYTSIAHGNHFVKFGARLRADREASDTTSGFNGTFTFSSLDAYRITELGLHQGLTPAQIRAAGGGADQFSITSGIPSVIATIFDAGLYAQDDWRLRPNLTLSYGLRFESQNQISDHADFGPRVALAWGLGGTKSKPPKTVLRAGFGLFYDRFGSGPVLQADRLNGINESQFIAQRPDFFPVIPASSSLASSQGSPTVYRIGNSLRAPVTYEAAFSVERQLTKTSTLALTYINSRGEHQLLLYNANAPLPETFDPAVPGSGIRPLGNDTNLYTYSSEGIFKQNQLIANFNVRAWSRVTLFGFYTLDYANGDLGTSGLAGSPGFVSNSYNFLADYGRAAFDVHHRLVLGGNISLPYAFRLNPFLLVTSGQPYNLSVGEDLNGDSIFNDRPSFAGSQTPFQDLRAASIGDFNIAPAPGEAAVPINYGTGPVLFTLNLRVSKSFGFGPTLTAPSRDQGPGERRGGGTFGGPGFGGGGMRGGGGGGGRDFGAGNRGFGPPGENQSAHRYNLTLSANARNLLNRQNLAVPVGDLQSPLFGESVALAGPPFSSGSASRRIDLQLIFSF